MQPNTQSSTAHRDAACQKLSAVGRKFFKFIEFDEKEELVWEIRKHPFGLVGIYLTGIIVALVSVVGLVGLGYFLRNDELGFGSGTLLQTIVTLIGAVIAIGALIMTAISAYLYQSNVIFVTNEKIAQVLYTSLLNRKISQLSIGDVQDVTVTQKGLFSRIFNYGTLVIETAGEQQNYTFTFVPQPYDSSQAIVNAHEISIHKYGN